jgi:hypothetical protein
MPHENIPKGSLGRRLFGTEERPTALRLFPGELKKQAKKEAIGTARIFPRSLVELGFRAQPGEQKFVPETKAEQFIFGREPLEEPRGAFQTGLTALGAVPPFFPAGRIGKVAKPLFKTTAEAAAKAAPTIDPIVAKVASVLKEAKVSRRAVTEEQRIERGIRFGKTEEAFGKVGGGEAGFRAKLGVLKGPLTEEPVFEPIRGKVTQSDINHLFNKIEGVKFFNEGEKVTTQSGLLNLLEGGLPQPKQLSLLEEALGSDFVREIIRKKPFKWSTLLKETINIPRVLQSFADSSAVLRQSAVLTFTSPIKAIKALGQMPAHTFSVRNYKGWLNAVKEDPLYPMFRNKGYLSDAERLADVTKKEELYMSNFAKRIPILGKLIGASERAYTFYLNKMRWDVWKDLARKEIKSEGRLAPEVADGYADMVNVFTGRGGLGKAENLAEELNTIFYSARFNTSRLQTFNPVWYAKQPKVVRKEAIKRMAQYWGSIFTIAGLAKHSGIADVEFNAASSDFPKIRIGKTRWDMTGGYGQFARLFYQLAKGERKVLSTGEIVKMKGFIQN